MTNVFSFCPIFAHYTFKKTLALSVKSQKPAGSICLLLKRPPFLRLFSSAAGAGASVIHSIDALIGREMYLALASDIFPPVCFLTFTDRGSLHQIDLTELIGVPLPPSVSFVAGFEGYPAYSFGPDANVGRLTKSFIPDPFYYDFAITVTAKPTTQYGGVLFAITNASQKVRPSPKSVYITVKHNQQERFVSGPSKS